MTAAIPDEAKVKFARRRVPLRRYRGLVQMTVVARAAGRVTLLVVDGLRTREVKHSRRHEVPRRWSPSRTLLREPDPDWYVNMMVHSDPR